MVRDEMVLDTTGVDYLMVEEEATPPPPMEEDEASDIVAVPETTPMAAMPPEVAGAIAKEIARALVDKKTEQVQVIDIDSLPLDLFGMIPQYGRWYWYRGWKRDPTDSTKIIYDLYVVSMKIAKILAKSLETIDTRWGAEKTKAYVLWTVIKARTYDPVNKRVVSIRQIMMTPLMARRGADVAKLLDRLDPVTIKKSVEYIKRHENLLWADMAQQKSQEADTAWAIVEKKADSHFKATEKMLRFAGEATDKGDEEFAKSFTENKDWKEKMADNWCLMMIGFFVLVYLIGYGLGWWVTG